MREYADPETVIAGIDSYVTDPAEEKLKVVRPAAGVDQAGWFTSELNRWA